MKDWISDEEKARDERRRPLHLAAAIILSLLVGFSYFSMFKSWF
jgi:hypothetical protein